MDVIETWFEGELDYDAGVNIYISLPQAKPRIIRKLSRGKNNHNMAQLIKELRTLKNSHKSESKFKKTPSKPTIVTTTKFNTDKDIANHYHKKQLKENSKKAVFGSVRYGELPAELRVRYHEAASLFYQMCDLKFALNDLDKEAVNESLSIQLQIESIDEKRETIWKELHHWQNHKTLLPTSSADFADMTEGELYRKRNNYRSQVTKLKKRIDRYYEKLDGLTDNHQIRLVEKQINRSEKKLHQHELNIDKINELL